MSTEPNVAAYNQALIRALRTADPREVRRFAATWGEQLGNRGLRQLAKADDAAVERRMWQMIRDRPDLADLHPRADAWLAGHPPGSGAS
jgi:hypothetical protein